MSKNFHRDYAESVGHFCQSIPAGLRITTQEVDTYFFKSLSSTKLLSSHSP